MRISVWTDRSKPSALLRGREIELPKWEVLAYLKQQTAKRNMANFSSLVVTGKSKDSLL